MRTGLLNLILILFGLWLCVKRKKPSMPVLALCELMLSMLLFTECRIPAPIRCCCTCRLCHSVSLRCGGSGREYRAFQNTKALFLGFYTVVRRVGAVLPAHCHGLARVRYPCVPPGRLAEYQRLDELTYDRKDKPQIQAMAQWLVEHLGEGEVAI